MGLRRLEQGVESYNEWAAENPRAARELESVVNVGLAFSPATNIGISKTARSFPEKVKAKLNEKADAQILKRKEEFVEDLLTPKLTPTKKSELVGRTVEEGGILNRSKVVPTKREAEIMDQVSKIPELNQKGTLQSNFNVIKEARKKEDITLVESLEKTPVLIPRKEIFKRLDQVIKDFDTNPLLVGDAQKQAVKIVNKMKSLIKENKGTGAGLLEARRQLDNFIAQQKGAKIFDPALESAFSVALREVRQTTNNFLDEAAKQSNVSQSLRKQSNLYEAMDIIAPKVAEQGGNSFSRVFNSLQNVSKLKVKTASDLAILGVGASAIASYLTSPILIGSLITGALAIKGARSAAAKRFIGKLIKAIDDSPQTALDLKADRAVLVGLLEADGDPKPLKQEEEMSKNIQAEFQKQSNNLNN